MNHVHLCFNSIVQFRQFSLNIMEQSDTEDITAAAQVTDWLTEGLPAILPNGIKPNLSKLALVGHSRGGHTAFSLVLGHGKTNLKFSAIIGVDPVGGQREYSQISPKILTYAPSSLDIAMPASVIVTGLGEEPKKVLGIPVLGPSAPKGVNHKEFYLECKPPCYHFVTEDYGHLDMIDDDAPWQINVMKFFVMQGNGYKDTMRRAVAGIMVAFLKAVLKGEDGDLHVILKDPTLAPISLNPVERSLA